MGGRILGCLYCLDIFQENEMDRDVLMHQMTERFQELYNQALDALDRTPDGTIHNSLPPKADRRCP